MTEELSGPLQQAVDLYHQYEKARAEADTLQTRLNRKVGTLTPSDFKKYYELTQGENPNR